MAIDDVAGGDSRIEVTTSAVNEALGTQSEQTGNNTIVLSDDFDTLANGDTEASIDYVDRLILIRRGTGTEEERRIITDSAGTGNLRILTVHEDWDLVPASSDDCQVSYLIQDMATNQPVGLLNMRNTDYTTSKRIQIGDGTNFAWFALLDGASFESVDNSSTTEADFTVNGTGNPRFSNGYLFSGNPVSGGYQIATPAVAGELAFECIDGGMCSLNDYFFTGIISHEHAFRASTTGSRIRGNKVKLFVQARELELLAQDTQITDLTVEGSGDTADVIRCRELDSSGFIKDFKLISTNGLTTRASDTSTETIEFRDIVFINNTQLIEVNSNKTWDIVNPVWSPTTADESDFDFLTGTSNIINERFSVDTTSLTVGGVALTAKVYVINADDGTGSESLAQELTADSGGLANADVIKREFTETGGGGSVDTATSATFAVISTQYGELPIITSYIPDNDDATVGLFGNKLSFAHLTDVSQVETTQGTAITLGDSTRTVVIEEQTNPAIIISWESGSGTLSVGDIIDNDVNGAEATLVEIIEGDGVEGTGIFDTANATAWVQGLQVLSDTPSAGDWIAGSIEDSVYAFDWLIDADTLTTQQLYDWLNAKADEATLDVTGGNAMDQVFFWANQGTNVLPIVGTDLSPNKFKTVRETVKTAGWAIYDLGGSGLGDITEYTSNDGTVFIPASTVTVKVTVLEGDFTTLNEGARVGVHRVSDNSEILNDLTDSNGEVSVSFIYTSDVDVFIRVRDEAFDYKKQPATIVSTGLDVTVVAEDDNVYA